MLDLGTTGRKHKARRPSVGSCVNSALGFIVFFWGVLRELLHRRSQATQARRAQESLEVTIEEKPTQPRLCALVSTGDSVKSKDC